MREKLLAIGLLCGVGLWSGGCISHQETVYHDEPRIKVEFENDSAARMFYEALSKIGRQGRTESRTEFDIVVLKHNRTVKEGENYAFNEAVRKCDTNQDGRITEMEARIFAEQHHH